MSKHVLSAWPRAGHRRRVRCSRTSCRRLSNVSGRAASHAAADGLAAVLDAAAAELVAEHAMRDATTLRPR